VPDPRSVFRLVALAAFLLLVALGLWLLDAEWPVIVAVMAAAWALAAVVEWAGWRQERIGRFVRPDPPAQTPAEEALEPPEGPAVILPPEPEATPPEPEEAPPAAGPQAPTPEPEPEPEPTPLPRPPLRPVPSPPPSPPPPVPPPAAARAAAPRSTSGVVDLRRRATSQPRQWNIWDLERLAREELQDDAPRLEELSYLFVHLRRFASADGSLPAEFDPLVRESLGDLLEQR
jgi:outer membrane biosynthesis protein TonB